MYFIMNYYEITLGLYMCHWWNPCTS